MASDAAGIPQELKHYNACPTCGGDLIKYGIQSWSPKANPHLIRRYQRYQCKVCERFTYEYLETIDIRNSNVLYQK